LNYLPHRWAATCFVWAGLSACSGPPALDADVIPSELKSDVIADVGETLLERGYVHGIDWLLWSEYVEQHRTALNAATTYGEFGSAINHALGKFGVSHLWVWTPEELGAQKTLGSGSRAQEPELRWPRSDVAWLSVPTFSHEIYDEDTIEQLFSEIGNAPALVLDLRSNEGGRSHCVEHLAAMVLPPGTRIGGEAHREEYGEFLMRLRREPETLLEVVNTTGQWVHTPDAANGPHFDGTLMVLVDARSGSGGEHFPAMIQDLGRGTVIGTPTAGKALAGDHRDIAGGYVLFYPDAELVRNDGSRIEGVGVQPDIALSARQTTDDEFILTVALWAIDAPNEPSPDAQIGLIIQ
jgi:hypothetical protein